MSKTQTLDVDELKALLLANFRAGQTGQRELQARIQQALDEPVQEEKSEVVAIWNKMMEQVSGLIARRLKDNRRDEPLFSSGDLGQFVSSLFDYIVSGQSDKLETKEREMLEKFLKTIFENVVEMTQGIAAPDKNPHDEYWRWVEIVFNLAAEHNMVPTELLAFQWARDEITRQMLTQEQFVAIYEKGTVKLMDIDALKKAYLQPILDMLVEDNEEERVELEHDFETEVMPQFRERFAKIATVMNAWYKEQASRIYSAT